jgi:soluble lytic murein transglycosylase
MRVPTTDTFQKSANVLPANQLAAPNYQNFAGKQAAEAMQASMAFSGEVRKIQLDIDRQADEVQVIDAMNKASAAKNRLTYDQNEGFKHLQGEAAMNRPDNKSMDQEYGERFQKELEAIDSGLRNQAQRQAFRKYAGEMMRGFNGALTQHMGEQFSNWQVSKFEGAVMVMRDQMALAAVDDPEAVAEAARTIKGAVAELGRIKGLSALEIEANTIAALSPGHLAVIASALEKNNPEYAEKYLSEVSNEMKVGDLLKAQKAITGEVNARESLFAADEEMQKAAPRIDPSDFDRAVNITAGTESGGRQFDDSGKPITSLKGAVGVMQVMKDTGPDAAKLAGLTWDEERWRNDPEYNMAIGRAYLAEQLRVNGGDLPMAWGAYNAGPGRLEEAVKKAEKDGNSAAWLSNMPAETQDYVLKNVQAYQSGRGRPSRPTLQELDANLRSNPRIANNPDRLKLARAEVERQYKNETAAIKQREDEIVTRTQEELVANGGNFSALSPSLQNAIPPGKRDEMLKYASTIAAGQQVVTDWNVYRQLGALSITKPEEFKKTNLALFDPKLAPEQRRHFADLQEKMNDPNRESDALSQARQIAIAIDELFLDKKESARFEDAVTQAITAERRAKDGRELTFEERRHIIRRMMLPGDSPGWSSAERVYQAYGTSEEKTFVPDIGSDDRKLIIKALSSEGVKVTESAIRERFNLKYGIK